MELFTIFLALTSLLLPVLGYNFDTACVDGITTDITEFTFAGGEELDYYTNLCTNNLTVHSVWAAAKVYCTPKQITAGEKLLSGYCEEYGLVKLVPYAEVLPLLTNEFISSLPIVEYSDVDATKILNHSVLISRDFYKAGMHTTSAFEIQYMLHQRYGWAVYGFWGGVLLLGIVNRLWTHAYSSRRTRSTKDVEGDTTGGAKIKSTGPHAVLSSAHHWVRANLIIPAAFGSHHNRLYFWCTIPTRMETLVLGSFYILIFILCCVSYDIFSPNIYYPKSMQAARYIADRTGIICYATLPILWIFSGRNNIFLWLTGWSFSTFNIFHRHVARIATVLAIVHSIGYTALEAYYGYLAESWRENYWYMGGMATITMSLLLVFSSIWFRQRCYEVFLIIHIALSVATIVGLFYHTKIFDGEYDGYLWPLVAIWVFDRLARLVRLAYCNIHMRLSGAPITSTTVATYNKDADVIRLEVTPGSRMLKPGPGQHYYIYQPATWKGWENHPFTLGAWHSISEGGKTISETSSSLDNDLVRKEIGVDGAPAKTPTAEASSATSLSSQEVKPDEKQQVAAEDSLVFFIRPCSSWTKRLRAECIKSPTGAVSPKTLIEGPYGEQSPLDTYENIVFVVGGTGIAGALPYLLEHVNRTAAANSETSKVSTRTRDITLVWSAKQSAMIRDLAARELQPVMGREDIHIEFHATSRRESPSTVEGGKALETSSGLNISYGRPDVMGTVLGVIEEVHAAGSAGGKIAILTCGPAAMADEARAGVHQALKAGRRGVEYFEETFGW